MIEHPAEPPAFHPGEAVEPRQRRSMPGCRVILHYDACYERLYIVRTIMELTRLWRSEATQKMWEAYHHGRSVLLVSYRERAELYVEQFAAKGLTVTIE